MALGMRPQSTMRRPTGPSNLATSMFGGLAAQQPMMPMLGAQTTGQPQPTATGRITIGGATPPNLAALFAEADKMAKEAQSSVKGGTMSGNTYQPSQETQNLYKDWQAYNNLYQYGYASPVKGVAALIGSRQGYGKQGPVALRKQLDQMSLGGMTQSEILKQLGYKTASDGSGQSAASTAAMKEAEAFLKSLGLGG